MKISIFSRNRESHRHSYETHISGWVTSYILEDSNRLLTFIKSFSKFLDELESNETSTTAVICLLLGLSIPIRKKVFSLDYIDDISALKLHRSIEIYFHRSIIDDKLINKIRLYSDKIESNGCPSISKAIRAGLHE